MDHVVYLDAKAKELEKLLAGQKSMIVRGATGRKMPYGRVAAGDVLYFINNNAESLVRARGTVNEVVNSEKLTEEQSITLLEQNQPRLNLTAEQIKRWGGKRYLVLISVGDVQPVKPFAIDRSVYGNMDDWLPVGEIESKRIVT